MKIKVVLLLAVMAVLFAVLIRSPRTKFAPGPPANRPGSSDSDLRRATRLAKAGIQPALSPAPPAPMATLSRPGRAAARDEPIANPPFARFRQWVRRYAEAGTPEARAALEIEGIDLARARRTAMADLIQAEPEQALALAVPAGARDGLPPSITALLETRVTADGDLDVIGVRPLPRGETALPPVVRAARIAGENYEVFTYGQGLSYVTRQSIPLNGIAVDADDATSPPAQNLIERTKLLALDPNPGRELEGSELNAALKSEPVCSVSGRTAVTALRLGTRIKSFCGKVHAQDWANAGIAASGLTTPSGSVGSVPTAESSYTEGRKRMLLMRPIWSDYTGGMTTNDAVTHFLNFSNYMYEMSYGKLQLAALGRGSDVTPPMLLSGLVADYDNTGLGKLYTTSRDTAQNSYGYNLGNYDFTYVCTAARPAATYAGLGFVGGVGFHLANSYWDAATACHEFGHNLGLNHAHFWDTSLQSVIGDGQNVEYGDNNDPMGGGGSPNTYNARYKNYLGWIPDSDVVDLNTSGSGLYRVYAFDLDNSSGLRGLKFRRNASQNYWVNLRQRKTTKKALMNGVQLMWTGNGNEGSYLLDVRLKGDADDNALVIGRTFSDPALGVHITAVGKAHTYPESIDVRVNIGTFPGNVPPSISLAADSLSVAAGNAINFTATASDPNGDALAYFWEFGDGDYSTNNTAAIAHTFTLAGEYVVQCTVSDMKGGVARDTVVARAGSPGTFRITGRVFDTQNHPMPGIRVMTDSGKSTFTEPDGSYTIAGLATGSYAVDAIEPLNGLYTFLHPAFNSPVAVGPNANAIDLIGVPTAQVGQTILMPKSAAGWRYLDNGTDQGVAWRAPLFDDSGWVSGTAALGYPAGPLITTLIGYGPDANNKFITYYFRHSFSVSDPNAFTSVLLETLRDDGVVIYVNGTEAYRNNMPSGPISYTTLASSRIDATAYLQATLPRSLLVPGNNVIAAEVHQGDPTSSDVTFDGAISGLSLSGISALKMLYLSSPADKAILAAPSSVTLNANALSSPGTINLVEFYADGTKIGESAASPYGVTWLSPSLGAHVLLAVASLGDGSTLTSPAVTVTVVPPAQPAVALVAPVSGASYVVPTNVTVQAAVTAAGAGVSSVQFYANDSILGQSSSQPYFVMLAGLAPGPVSLTAVLLTTGGDSFTSAPVNITLAQPALGTQIISFGEAWKYFDDGSNLGTAWRARSFDDRGWPAGPGRLGYGGDGEVTLVYFGPSTTQRYVTTYFRKSFVVPDPSQFNHVLLRLLRDDGAVVYLNGAEILRDNLLPGVVSWNSLALTAIEGTAESTPVESSLNSGLFLAGTNVLAVEIHQATPSSADLGFDLALIGQQDAPVGSTFYLTQPAAGARATAPAPVVLAAYNSSGPIPGGVTYYAEGNLLGSGAGQAPYALSWSNAPVGSHTLQAVADFGGGITVTAAPVNVTVVPRPPLIQPFSSTIITAGAAWKYLDSASPVAVGWAQKEFDDSSWPSGTARFGWGLDGEKTPLTPGRVTTYFRRWFVFAQPAIITELNFQLARDDGAAVYLNGTEIFRSNLGPGQLLATTLALSSVIPPEETTFFGTVLPSSGSGLLGGSNLVAVELHQASAGDPDAGFDLQLMLSGNTDARIYLATPVAEAAYPGDINVIHLEANVRGAGGAIVTNVEFRADGFTLDTASAAPWRTDWNNAPTGPHVLTAVAKDNSGGVLESSPVQIHVGRTPFTSTLIASNSVWKYFVTPTTPGASWATASFNDSTWPAGPARLGYGGDGEVTLLGFGGVDANKYITTYFRRRFSVTAGAVYTNLFFKLLRDDGAVAWLNGRELFRSNMPDAPAVITYQTLASTTVSGADEQTFFSYNVAVTNLAPGTNVLAVEIHQAAANSSDIGFDLELTAAGYVDAAIRPALHVAAVDGSVEFSWPATALGFRVLEADRLDLPIAAWTQTAGSLVQFPDRFVLTVPPPDGPRFYRLFKP